MPNKNPVQTELFKQKRFTAIDNAGESFAKKPLSVKIPTTIHDVLEGFTPQEKAALVREILKEGLEKRNLL